MDLNRRPLTAEQPADKCGHRVCVAFELDSGQHRPPSEEPAVTQCITTVTVSHGSRFTPAGGMRQRFSKVSEHVSETRRCGRSAGV